MANNVLILASSSPRRQELLKELHIPIHIVTPEVEEKNMISDPRELVLHNAEIKAKSVLKKFKNNPILAADTIVTLGNKIFNKPKDLKEGKKMLQKLSGKTHIVYTGICIIYEKKNLEITHVASAEVTFRILTDDIIDRYHKLVNPLDRAGAYSFQDFPQYIIHSYKGYMSTIIGLPMEYLRMIFHKLKLFYVPPQ